MCVQRYRLQLALRVSCTQQPRFVCAHDGYPIFDVGKLKHRKAKLICSNVPHPLLLVPLAIGCVYQHSAITAMVVFAYVFVQSGSGAYVPTELEPR